MDRDTSGVQRVLGNMVVAITTLLIDYDAVERTNDPATCIAS